MLSDDPVDLRGQGGGGQPGRQPLGRGDEALEFLEPVEDDGQPHWFTPGPTSNRKVALPQKSHPNAPTIPHMALPRLRVRGVPQDLRRGTLRVSCSDTLAGLWQIVTRLNRRNCSPSYRKSALSSTAPVSSKGALFVGSIVPCSRSSTIMFGASGRRRRPYRYSRDSKSTYAGRTPYPSPNTFNALILMYEPRLEAEADDPFAAWRMGGILALPLPWRSRTTRYLSIAAIAILIATPVFGQSLIELVEAAKKAQEQRESTDSPSRVWTNADLPRNGRPRTATGTTRRSVPVTRVRPIPQRAAEVPAYEPDSVGLNRSRLLSEISVGAQPTRESSPTILCSPIGVFWSDDVPCLSRRYRDLVEYDPWCPGSVNCGDPVYDYAVQPSPSQ